MEAIVRIKRVGGFLAFTIPRKIVKEECIGEDELVRVKVWKIRKSMRLFNKIKQFKKE